MSPKPSKSLALRIVQRMGETGQPPERGALFVNVGTEEQLEILRARYLAEIRETGRISTFKLVEADFGGGKTHFLSCLREIAWREGFVTSFVVLSPEECPFDDGRLMYGAVARALELPPKDEMSASTPGIDAVLRTLVSERVARHGKETVVRWLEEEFARAPIESYAVRRAAWLFMLAVIDRDIDREEALAAYLRGDELKTDELAEYKLREKLDDETAFRFMRSLAQILQTLGVPGVALLFDEFDRNLSLPQRRRRAIGDNLRQMIDLCGTGKLPGVVWVYAVPPEFRTRIIHEYPALAQRLEGAGDFAALSPMNPIINLERLPVGAVELLKRIGVKLLEVFEIAFDKKLDELLQRSNIEALAREFGENQLEVGARRQFVKAVISMLGSQANGVQQKLSLTDVKNLARRMRQAPAAPAGPAVPLGDEKEIF